MRQHTAKKESVFHTERHVSWSMKILKIDMPRSLEPLIFTVMVIYPSSLFAVGMPVARHPPHRSQRAILSHWAPALSHNAKTLFRIRMIDAGDREPLVHVMLHTTPGDVAFMAPS